MAAHGLDKSVAVAVAGFLKDEFGAESNDDLARLDNSDIEKAAAAAGLKKVKVHKFVESIRLSQVPLTPLCRFS